MSDKALWTGAGDGNPDQTGADVDPTAAPVAYKGGAQLAVSAAAYWAGTGVTLAGSLVRGKVAAVVLGTSGLGVISQLATFSALVAAVAAMGLGTGGVKLIAEARSHRDDAEIRRLVSFILWAPAAAGTVLFVAVVVAARPLALLLLEDTDYARYLVLGAAAIPFALLLTSYQVVMQAFESALRLALNSAVTAALVTAAAVPLTIVWGLDGAVAAIPLAAFATLAVFMLREPWVLRLATPPRRLGARTRRALSVLAGASMAASVIALGSDVVLRASAVRELGIDDIGLYQPVQILSTVILTQMAGALSLVLLPRLSIQLGLDDKEEMLRTLTKAARASVVFVVPVLLLLMAARDLFIVALFDSSFLGISGVLAISLVAEVPRFSAYALGSAMLPAGLVRLWLLSSVVSMSLRLAVGLALLPWIGLYAFAASTVVQWMVVLVYTAWVLRNRMAWRPDARLAWLAVLGTALVSAAAAVSMATAWGELLLPLAAVAWGWLLGRRETRLIVSAFLDRVRRPRAA